jgi:purine-binding chemotaxis protein CheW
LTSAASDAVQLTVFVVDGRRYGLHLDATVRVVPMVAIAPLPGGPAAVRGAINVHGEVVPVLDVRRRLNLPESDYGPSARLLLARSARRKVALPVDDVLGVVEVDPERVAAPHTVVPRIDHVAGVAALADGLLLIHDLDTFFSLDEERQLDDALGNAAR